MKSGLGAQLIYQMVWGSIPSVYHMYSLRHGSGVVVLFFLLFFPNKIGNYCVCNSET